ncbi:MAG: FAD-dependent oxidoreductase [Pseudomonadota bacterium]
MIKADLCIIGAGSAGLSVAAGAAQLGRSVVLIEKGEMGGDCLNYGCVPSKALLAAAAAAEDARQASKFGVRAEPVVDFAAVMAHVRGVIETIAPVDSQERFEGFGVNVIREKAAFIDHRTVKAGEHTIRAKHFVIATGSSPIIPPIDGLNTVEFETNETIFTQTTAPRHLVILGGGPIGVEMAQAHRRLGADVTIIDAAAILSREDAEAAALVKERLTTEGVRLIENTAAAQVAQTGETSTVTLQTGDIISGDRLLVAVGRRANTAGLDLEKAGVKTNKQGVVTDARLRTDNKRIYAAGDVAGGKQFTHVAGDHASTLVRNILFKTPAKRRDDLAPHATYCDPELASVGLTETAARENGERITVSRWSFEENDRAQAERRTDGFIKVVTRKNGVILGAALVGKGAGDQITAWAHAIANRQKIGAFTKTIAPYPTRSEISKRAAGAFYTPTLFSARTRALVSVLSLFD